MGEKALRVLKGFNARKLNKYIDTPDKLGYDKIFVAESNLYSGIKHIRERHIDDVVKVYCTICMPDAIPSLEFYVSKLQLSDFDVFKQYHDSLRNIRDKTYDLLKLSRIPRQHYKTWLRDFYSSDLMQRLEKHPPQKSNPQLIEYASAVKELSSKLQKTRALIQEPTFVKKINDSIEQILSKVAEDPEQVVKDEETHMYVSRFWVKTIKGYEEKFVFFVVSKGIDRGELVTARCVKPDEIDEQHVIYTRPKC